LLDIVTASYYTDSGEEYQYGNNPAKTEPVLKITGKVSTARDLVLDRHGNTTVGLMVIGAGAVSKGGSELSDLLGRKVLKFAHIATGIDSECVEDIIKMQEDAAVFACTREYLLQNSLPPQEKNVLTLELERQVENIVYNSVTEEIVDGGCSWEDLRKAREALYIIKKSVWNDDAKSAFIIVAHSLLNLFITAAFPIETLEKAVESGNLMAGVRSPALRIRELWNLADKAGAVKYHCTYVADILERLYKFGLSDCSKYFALKRLIESSRGRKIAVVVPKAYYVDILDEDETIHRKGINIITANRFDNSVRYDEIIVVGDFGGKRFDPLKCRAASNIIVLLYDCETHWFKHKKNKAKIFEKKLNFKLGIASDDIFNQGELEDDNAEIESMDAFVAAETDLEQYINNISAFDIRKYVAGDSGSMGNAFTSEVWAIGRFVSGEKILFTKYYNAVVFDSAKRTVSETDAECLSVGDQILFVKRDGYTRNMVDYVYENLQETSRLNADVLDATEKATYWKEVLREYKITHNLSYRDIAKRLQKFGSSLQEVTVRQWLIEESHIVGPRDEATLRQIAEMTQDSYILGDTHSYFEACRVVRRQRKEILELIGKAITDKLSGHKPPGGSVLEIVYDNVENLSEILELDAITLLKEPANVPINLINKPITDWEVTS
ncbi:MAG TPA: DrmE family protein, partial [Anaerovoracaceae bacterium]|nr:DrmE family protein [Anaerovoracaceae bacterium]